MTKTELARLACAVAIHRPDWPEASIRTFLERHLGHRPYQDIAVALTWIATDPNTATPARVLEPGPWWQAASTRDVPTPRNPCLQHPLAAIRSDPRTGEQTCGGCHADQVAADTPLPLRRRGVPPSPEVREQLRAAITPAATPDDATSDASTEATDA